MKYNLFEKLIILLVGVQLAGTSFASELIYSEDFNHYSYDISWPGDEVWSVTGGTVDIIGDGTPFALAPVGNGLYIDLDGSGTPATFAKKSDTVIVRGNTYLWKFDLAGNQGAHPTVISSPTDTVRATVLISDSESGGFELNSLPLVIPKHQGFKTYFVSLRGIDGTASISFVNSTDGDLQGALLDNVILTTHPTLNVGPCHSGSWYWPDQDGHGFSIEVGELPDGSILAVVYWYTYDSAGNPVFMIGTGVPDGDLLNVKFVSPAGMKFGEFDPDSVIRDDGGTGEFVFTDENTAIFKYKPSEYSAGVWGHSSISYMPLEKFFGIPTNDCADGISTRH